MDKALKLANAIGRKKLAGALGVGPTAVSNAVVRGWFPATWFMVVSDLADQVGADCPPELFKMRPLDNPQFVDMRSDSQGNESNTPSGAA